MRRIRSACVVSAVVGAGIAMAMSAPGREPPRRDDSAAESLGWRLGVQAWTFRDRSALEAIDAAHALGVKYMEFYPGQRLRKDDGAKLDVGLEEMKVKDLAARLSQSGVRATGFGVVTLTMDEERTRKVFEFAKSLGVETISCEPEADAFDLVERMSKQHSMKAAVHNHPKPSAYWDPKTVLTAVGSRGPMVGACADTGHWSRSGLIPLDCLKKLEGRIVELHFKDIADGQDRPWGTGAGNARGMLEELRRQGFKGVILIEYETGSGAELEANAAKCVEFFDKACREIVAAEAKAKKDKPPGP